MVVSPRLFDVPRPRRLPALAALVAFLTSLPLPTPPSVHAQSPDALSPDDHTTHAVYLNEVKPLLQTRCYACHGANRQQASLRLDTGERLRQGGDSGPAVIPGKPSDSLLLQRVQAHDQDARMPPEAEGEPLTAEQVELLRRWIAEGATSPADEQPETDWREHWAFRPRQRPTVPAAAARASSLQGNAIDAFLEEARRQPSLRPTGEAPREVLIRRVYLDLIGLPPTPADWDALLSDARPDWYERLVDRLLADPRHGERWGRHWMDVWRYSDWWGLGDQLRNSQKHIWHWRDWIVESINDDLPYDEMVRLMLAADESHPTDLRRLRATGFLARNYFLFNRHQWMDETVEHVSKAFLGLTMNCAKCHDHKFDPIVQEDYYRMRAIFEPYHVRLDVMPGATSMETDGLPRVYDGHLDQPTYVLIRGQETMPDKSLAMEPGLPAALAPHPLDIQPIVLPAESWQPERRPWVLDDHRDEAERRRDAARAKVSQARAALATPAAALDPAASNSAPTPPSPSLSPSTLAEWTLRVAEQELLAADADLVALERRIAAMRAEWALVDGANLSQDDRDGRLAAQQALVQQAARDASRAEREATVARARLALATQEMRLANHEGPATEGKAEAQRAELEAEVTKARDALRDSITRLAESSDQFTRIPGAVWTATRFLDSTKDDPTVAFSPTSTGRRLALARWITAGDNPLTARVAANHLWMRHMGAPLLPTLFDLGRKGTPPTHPELLDWLASELVDSGWDMKRLHRQILLSAAYRMDSSPRGHEQELAADPDNRLWWRWRSTRIEAEVVRDSLLSLASELDGRLSGPPVVPAEQEDSRRRSLYFFHSNNERNLFLATFDEALVKECYRREQSIVPQQALALSNSRLVLDMASRIARQLEVATGTAASATPTTALGSVSSSPAGVLPDDDRFLRQAFLVLLGMRASDAELAACRQALAAWRSQPDMETTDARTYLVWALLNHNDFVTQR